MTSSLIPAQDLVPSVASRVVRINVVDMTEGAPAAGHIDFILPCDLHVPADDKIIKAGSTRITLVNGQGEIRLPTYDPDIAIPGEWEILVKKSWAPYPYPIRVPEGTTAISLADIAPVRELSWMEQQYAITGASVSVTTGSPGGTVSVSGGVLKFNLTIPSGDWLRGEVPLNTDLNGVTLPGVHRIANYTLALSMLNRPTLTAAVNPAILTVTSLNNGAVKQVWETMAGADRDAPILSRRRDNGGTWTDWVRDDEAGSKQAVYASAAAHQAEDGVVSLLAGLTSDPDAPWLWRAAAGTKLITPTHEGSGQATHPSVLYFPAGRWGWKYWMAMTPYPFSEEGHEDPDILVSNDGTTWQVPAGLSNPLDNQPGRPGPHNSDTHLVELTDGRLMLSWRTVDRPNGNRNIFYQRISSDGVAWTPRAELWTAPATGDLSTFVSQSIVRVRDRWRLYGISTGGTNALRYIESTAAVPTPASWSAPQVCTVRGVATDREMWHPDVQYVGGQWWALINDGLRGTSAQDGDIHVARSADGITWDYSPTPLVPRITADHDNLYKAGFIVGDGVLDVFYSAYTRDTLRWHIYRTTAVKATAASDMALAGPRVLDLTTEHLDTLLEPCEFRQSTDGDASVANGYPDVRPSSPGSGWAGVGSVKRWGDAGHVIQTYQPRIGPAWVRERYTSWGPWRLATPAPESSESLDDAYAAYLAALA